jgi:tetratricopeptide (TPR) repeat protein
VGDDELLTHLMWSRAIGLLEAALRDCPGNGWAARQLAECLATRARESFRSNESAAALVDLARARTLAPGMAALPRAMAQVHAAAAGGDAASPHLREALALLDEAIRLHPRHEAARVERAAALATLHRDADAEKEFRAVLEMRPDSVLAMADYAQLLTYLKRDAEALALVDRGLALEPDSLPLLNLQERLAPGR